MSARGIAGFWWRIFVFFPFTLWISIFGIQLGTDLSYGGVGEKFQQGGVVFAVNCGGPDYVGKDGIIYQADTYFRGGRVYGTTSVIAGTEDDAVYQTERFGNFSYSIPLPNGIYLVTFKFAEIYDNAPGRRVFNVLMEGKEVISRLDIFSRVGKFKTYDELIPIVVNDGILDIDFTTVKGNAKVSAIVVMSSQSLPQYAITASAGPGGKITPSGEVKLEYGSSFGFAIAPDPGYKVVDVKVDGISQGPITDYAFHNIRANHRIEAIFFPQIKPDQVVAAINCGGTQYLSSDGIVYRPDGFFAGGNVYKNPVGISNTEDDALYQSERFGNFSYNIPMANGSYLVVLKFAEIYPYVAKGGRVFGVKMEGKEVVSKLDLFDKAGKYKAYDVDVLVDILDGALNIEFQTIVGNAKINAILVVKAPAVKGIVQGTITDSSTKLPLPGVLVSIIDSSNTPKSGPSNAEGKYSIPEIVPGDIRGEMRKDGYLSYSFQRNISPGERLNVDGALDPIRPVIKDISIRDITANSAVIFWETDQPADSLVEYGLTESYGGSAGDEALRTRHRITLRDLSFETVYHFKVTSRNIYGVSSSSEDRSFSTTGQSKLIELKINYPENGDTISGADVRVEGDVVNTTGAETGVVVNGMLANVLGDKFYANHVPLQEGPNAITAIARDVNGEIRSDSVEVHGVSAGSYIRITTPIQSGISPFETVLNLDSNLDLTNASLTYTGPGEVEIVSTGNREYRVKMQTEGVYLFSAKISEPAGMVYENNVALTVFSRGNVDNLLIGKWEGMRANLATGDIETSLFHFDELTRDNYEEVFRGLVPVLADIAQEMGDIQLVKFSRDYAIYDIRTVRDGVEYSFQLLFSKDSNGLWKINSF